MKSYDKTNSYLYKTNKLFTDCQPAFLSEKKILFEMKFQLLNDYFFQYYFFIIRRIFFTCVK